MDVQAKGRDAGPVQFTMIPKEHVNFAARTLWATIDRSGMPEQWQLIEAEILMLVLLS